MRGRRGEEERHSLHGNKEVEWGMLEFEMSPWKVGIARKVSLGTISTMKRSTHMTDGFSVTSSRWSWMCTDRHSRFPRSCRTHRLAEFRQRQGMEKISSTPKEQDKKYQISAETPWNRITRQNKNTPLSNSTVTKGRQLSAYFLIELVPKASLAALFSI